MYKLLYCDPPWSYDDNKSNNPSMGGKKYPMLTDEELVNLPIYKIMDRDSLCFMWMTWPKVAQCLHVMTCWGFTPVTCGFVWIKLNKNGNISYNDRDISLNKGVYSGLGSYVCGNTEFCYIGKRGRGLPRINKSVKQLIFSPLRAHSSKPIEVYDRIDLLYGDIPRIELFARTIRDGWVQTGLDMDNIDIRDYLESHII